MKRVTALLSLYLSLLALSACGDFNAQGGVLLPVLLAGLNGSVNPPPEGETDSGGNLISISQSSGSTYVSEGSGIDAYTITINEPPQSTVTVQASFDPTQIKLNGSSVSPVEVVFSTTDSEVSRSLVVSAVNDTLPEGLHTATISHTITGGDPDFSGATLEDVLAHIIDNDSAGVYLMETGGSTVATEGGAPDSYDIVLTQAPTASVDISIASDSSHASLGGAGSSLTFTPANWYTPQTVTVTAVEEGIQDGTVTTTLTHSVSSADGNFNGVAVQDLVVTTIDNDSPGVSVTESAGETAVTEGSTTDSYDLVLTTAPSAVVTIQTKFDSSQVRVNGSSSSPVSLSFTASNWNTPQTVLVEAVDDSDIEGIHSRVLQHSATSDDSDYAGVHISDVNATIIDDDISPMVGSGVQTGEVNASGVAATDTINPVDLSRSFVICTNRVSSSNTNNMATCQLSSSSTVEYESGGGSNNTLRYYVVEFASGASVQRGSETIGSGSLSRDVSLTAVDLDRSFVLLTSRADPGGSDKDEQRTIMGYLSDPNTLRLTRDESGTNVHIEWQVIELDAARVQSGQVTISSGATDTIAPISPIDTSSALLFFNTMADSASNGVEAEVLPHGVIDSSTSVFFERGSSSNSVDISYFVVELLNGTSIQKGSANEGVVAGDTFTYTIPTAVDDAFAVPFISSWSINASPDANDQDTSTFTAEINPAGDQINLTRGQAGESRDTRFEWYVMELTSGP